MPVRDCWWKVHGKPLPGAMWECLKCGEVYQARGGKFAYHMWDAHGVEDPKKVKKEADAAAVVEVEAAVEEVKAAGLSMTREQYKEWLQEQMRDASLQGPARIAAGKVYGEVEGYLGDPPEKDMAEKEKVWREMHRKALKEIQDVRAMILHELRSPVRRGELAVLMEEAAQ